MISFMVSQANLTGEFFRYTTKCDITPSCSDKGS